MCLDLPGFGTEHERLSPSSIAEIADDVRTRFTGLANQEPRSWSILGISLGGMVALDWCARYPDDFERCVTINTSANPSPRFDRFSVYGVKSALVSTLARDAFKKERAILSLTTSSLAADRLNEVARAQATWFMERRPRTQSVARQLRAAMRFTPPTRVRPPVLVLASKTDRLVSHRCSERIAHSLGANAKLSLHDRGGHDLAMDEPEWICNEVSRSL